MGHMQRSQRDRIGVAPHRILQEVCVEPYGTPGGPPLPPGATLVGPLAVQNRVKSYSVRTAEGHEEIFPECELSELPPDIRSGKIATVTPLAFKEVTADGRGETVFYQRAAIRPEDPHPALRATLSPKAGEGKTNLLSLLPLAGEGARRADEGQCQVT